MKNVGTCTWTTGYSVVFSSGDRMGGVDALIPQTVVPGQTATPQPTVTPYSLQATNTPDLFVLNTLAPTDTPATGTLIATNTPTAEFTATIRPTITLEPVDPIFFTPSPNLFLNVQRSTDQMVWGSTCEGARFIKFTAAVQYVRFLRYVTLWYRLQDKYSGRHTDWGGGAIFARGGRFKAVNARFVGKFSHSTFVRLETGAAPKSGRKPRSAGIGNGTGVAPASCVDTP